MTTAADPTSVVIDAQIVIRAVVRMAGLAIKEGDQDALADALVCAERLLAGVADALAQVEMAIR